MKTLFPFILMVVVTITARAQTNESVRETESSVSEATVYLEGAQVTRKKSIDLLAGTTLVKFIGLSPDIDPQSIQVKASGSVTVMSVNHQLNFLKAQKNAADAEALKKQIEEIDRQVEDVNLKIQVLSEQLTFLSLNRQLSGKDQALSVTALKEADAFYQSRISQIKTDDLLQRRTLVQLEQKRIQLTNQLNGLAAKYDPPTGEIEVKVDARTAAHVNFVVSYLVKKAGWYPSYDIRANSIDQPVEVTYKANVFQNTGEEWNKVKLTFSTGNPRQSGVAPQLQTYLLDYYLRPPVYNVANNGAFEGVVYDENGDPLIGATVVVPGSTIGTVTDVDGRFSLMLPPNTRQVNVSFLGCKTQSIPVTANQSRVVLENDNASLDEVVVMGYATDQAEEAPVSTALRGRGAGVAAKPSLKKMESLPVAMETHQTQTSVLFQIEMPYTIPSGNKRMAVEMQHISMDAGFEHYAVPKIDKDAFLLAHITNWEQYNLMGGEANIFFEGTFTGKTIIDPASFKDTLTLSLGRDKSIVIGREKAKDFRSRQILGNKVTDERQWVISVRNPKAQTVHLTLMDQVPVSNREEIEVSVLSLSGGELTKSSGQVKWLLELKPDESKKLDLKYQVKYPKDRQLSVE